VDWLIPVAHKHLFTEVSYGARRTVRDPETAPERGRQIRDPLTAQDIIGRGRTRENGFKRQYNLVHLSFVFFAFFVAGGFPGTREAEICTCVTQGASAFCSSVRSNESKT
jgi:hypothetical protein